MVVAGAWRASVLRSPTAAVGSGRDDRHSSLLQLCAWGVPAALAAAVLVTRDVDADELTGGYFSVCFISPKNKEAPLCGSLKPFTTQVLLAAVTSQGSFQSHD